MTDKHLPNIKRLAQHAQRHLAKPVYDYFAGGASGETTLSTNSNIYNEIAFIPRVLNGITDPSTTVSISNLQLPHPIIIAPTAYHGLLHENGEAETALGAAQSNSVYCQSLMSTVALSATTQSNHNTWMQVYVLTERDKFQSLLDLCNACNVKNIVITVDSSYLGMRTRDGVSHFSLPESLSLAVLKDIGIDKSNIHYKNHSLFAKDITWDDLVEINQQTSANIYLKGILHPQDAKLAVQHDFAGVVLSNHGGRQLDTAIHPLRVLQETRRAVGDEFPIIIDGGVSSGFDILKAICLGANAVMIGKPVLWALYHSGRDGVAALLERMEAELINAMRLCGIYDLGSLRHHGGDYIRWG